MSSFDLTSPLVRELRAARPVAPDSVRERVAVAASREPEARFALPSRFAVRRFALVAVPACLAVAIGVPVIHGLVSPSRDVEVEASKSVALDGENRLRGEAPRLQPITPATTVPYWDTHADVQRRALAVPKPKTDTGGLALTNRGAGIAPNRTRLTDYRASLTLRVDGLDALSPSTQDAMRTVRSLGGYVVSAHFNAAKQGYSELVVRVPINRVQQAIARFSDLGAIAAQNIQITDLQARYNRLAKQVDTLTVQIAKIDDQLADPSLSNVERVRLQHRRSRLVSVLRALTTAKTQTAHQASLATISLTLTTEQGAVVHKKHHQGTIGRAFDDAGSILAKEVSWVLYALVILGPVAALALLAFLLVRVARRYSDRRLLETS